MAKKSVIFHARYGTIWLDEKVYSGIRQKREAHWMHVRVGGEIEGQEVKVQYIGKHETPALDKKRIYTVLAIEKGWLRIMTELGEDYLFPPNQFRIIEEWYVE